MAKKKQPYRKKPFESTGSSSDTSANIYMSMMLSPAWKDLTANQQRLYLYCKGQYYGEKQNPGGDPLCFTMNQSKWADRYGLYKRNNAAGFIRDMTALITHGFVTCATCGANTRSKSIYRFSDMWQQWGTDAFKVLPSEMTLAMQRKEQSKKEVLPGKLY